MKKIIIAVLLVSLLIVAGCATSSAGSADSPERLAGNDGGSADTEGKTAVKEIVKIPYVLKNTNYFSDGYIESYMVYTYDENMKVVREDLFDSFDEIIESAVSEVLEDGSVKRELFDSRGILKSWRKTVNDGNENPIRIESYSADDELQTVSEYSYNEIGGKTLWRVLDADGIVISETRYLYEDGLNTRIDIYDASMTLYEYFVNEYEDGRRVKNSHFDADGKLKAAIEYVYTEGAVSAEKYLRANGSTSRTVSYINDAEGSHLKAEYFDGNGKLKDWTETEYEYVSEEVTVWK
ncbi:MAG: hypothetical protein PQJ61_02220 [Spirochaetales bacterium]|uniref:Uncharacterized protein n=1 Tax=Candidatus Thalassospirochaeta sargassi TaxID=3119039 RepID=A0AAJ1MLA7_9SPIO|nr:hypothetical protein [Spirochaetales bacterium]